MNVIEERDPTALRLHDAASQVPRMRPEEWEAFLADVDSQGVLEPIVCTPEGVILDGRHRWEAAKILHLEAIPARDVNLTDLEQVQWIFRAAVLRRHLNDDQRAVLAARMREPLSKAVQSEAGSKARAIQLAGDSHTSCESPPVEATSEIPKLESPPRTDTRAQMAEQFNVPRRKVDAATRLTREAPALAEQVLSGDKSLREAQRERARAENVVMETNFSSAGIYARPAVVQARIQRRFADPIRALIALEPTEVAQGVSREEVGSMMGQLREWCEALEAAMSDPLVVLEGGRS